MSTTKEQFIDCELERKTVSNQREIQRYGSRKRKKKLCSKKEKKMYAALQYADSFHCLEIQLLDCEELEPKSQEKLIFSDKKSEETNHRTYFVCRNRQVSMYDILKRQQIHEDVRKSHRTKNIVKSFGQCESDIWEVMTS